MAVQIKVGEEPYQEKTITLNGETFYLRVMFNDHIIDQDRDGFWFIDILDRDRNPLRTGIKVVSNSSLTRHYHDLRKLLDGDIFVLNVGEVNPIIGRNNFGTNKQYQLVYISFAELAGYLNG